MSQFSVYIPRIFDNIPTHKIVNTFELLDLGKVDKIDIILKTNTNGTNIKMAFVHFSEWYTNSAAINFRQNVENPNIDAKLVYDDPWHWIVLPNVSAMKENSTTYSHDIDTRLQNIENKIAYLYDNLLPNINYSLEEKSVMSISELQVETPLHQSPNYANIYPESNHIFDDSFDLTSDDDEKEEEMKLFHKLTIPSPVSLPQYILNDLTSDEDEEELKLFDKLALPSPVPLPQYKLNDLTIETKKWVTANYCGNN